MPMPIVPTRMALTRKPDATDVHSERPGSRPSTTMIVDAIPVPMPASASSTTISSAHHAATPRPRRRRPICGNVTAASVPRTKEWTNARPRTPRNGTGAMATKTDATMSAAARLTTAVRTQYAGLSLRIVITASFEVPALFTAIRDERERQEERRVRGQPQEAHADRFGSRADRAPRELRVVIVRQVRRQQAHEARKVVDGHEQARRERQREIDQVGHRGRRVGPEHVADREAKTDERDRTGEEPEHDRGPHADGLVDPADGDAEGDQ